MRRMLGDLDAPYMHDLMRLIETQSKATVARWCLTYSEQHILPIYEKTFPADARPRIALASARAYYAGTVAYRAIKNECSDAARQSAAAPAAQAAARACHQSVAVAHTTRHALGFICYGAAALVYDRAGLTETDEAYERLAQAECAKMHAALQAIAVKDEPNPATPNWHCFLGAGSLFRCG